MVTCHLDFHLYELLKSKVLSMVLHCWEPGVPVCCAGVWRHDCLFSLQLVCQEGEVSSLAWSSIEEHLGETQHEAVQLSKRFVNLESNRISQQQVFWQEVTSSPFFPLSNTAPKYISSSWWNPGMVPPLMTFSFRNFLSAGWTLLDSGMFMAVQVATIYKQKKLLYHWAGLCTHT